MSFKEKIESVKLLSTVMMPAMGMMDTMMEMGCM